eukprot:GFUD01034832.1.p1 GENE.GFUD01034832.1~~GFUD01034832.1.p1  ORF type:complete len:443 (+),score=86.53 GFUD01034832.1:124-1452(+)
MSGEVKMTRRRAKTKHSQPNGSEMSSSTSPVSPDPDASPPSSPEGHQDPPQESPLLEAEQEKVLEIVEKCEKVEKLPLVLWRNPITVLQYSSCELVLSLLEGAQALIRYRVSLAITTAILVLLVSVHNFPGSHQESLFDFEKYLLWCGWWVGLGILSSVGLGTGLHTFLLYLGPHIAAVTMAAYECGTTDFPAPPYPSQILCPPGEEAGGEGGARALQITIWAILSKVRVEAFCWGAGTAIGELPPYFMARAARLSGSEPGEDTEEFLELQEKLKHPEKMTRFERMKYSVQQLVEKVGFFGILACASIPNPLFDLAGITCGHFLIPFWTFFGATLIGKAIIKMHIQKIFVILAFNQQLVETSISFLVQVPYLGPKLEAPVRNILAKQKEKLHNGGASDQGGSILSSIFEKFVLLMVTYFVVSIVNSLAQSYEKRLAKSKHVD